MDGKRALNFIQIGDARHVALDVSILNEGAFLAALWISGFRDDELTKKFLELQKKGFGQFTRIVREYLGLSQQELSKRLGYKNSVQCCKWEKGEDGPSRETKLTFLDITKELLGKMADSK